MNFIFLNLLQGLSSGHKNRMNLPMMLVTEFRDKLTDFADVYASLGMYYNFQNCIQQTQYEYIVSKGS